LPQNYAHVDEVCRKSGKTQKVGAIGVATIRINSGISHIANDHLPIAGVIPHQAKS
jgi:hypothetical protein